MSMHSKGVRRRREWDSKEATHKKVRTKPFENVHGIAESVNSNTYASPTSINHTTNTNNNSSSNSSTTQASNYGKTNTTSSSNTSSTSASSISSFSVFTNPYAADLSLHGASPYDSLYTPQSLNYSAATTTTTNTTQNEGKQSNTTSQQDEKVNEDSKADTSRPRRLGWGQGLVAFEKKKKPNEEESTTSPQQIEKEECDAQSVTTASVATASPFVTTAPVPVVPNTNIAVPETEANPLTTVVKPATLIHKSQQRVESVKQEQVSTYKEASAKQEDSDVEVDIDSVEPEVKKPVSPYNESHVIPKPAAELSPSKELELLPTKEFLLTEMDRLDTEIAQTEANISKQINAIATGKQELENPTNESSNQSLEQRVISQNNKTSDTVNKELPPCKAFANPAIMLSKVTTSIIKKHMQKREMLLNVVRSRMVARQRKQRKLTWQYNKLAKEWRKIHDITDDNYSTDSTKKTDNNESTESSEYVTTRVSSMSNINPRRQRRPSASSDVVRSEEELSRIIEELSRQDNQDPNRRFLKTLAIIPPMLTAEERRNTPRFLDNNRFVEDCVTLERERKQKNPWTETEKATFLKKFLIFPKQFTKIASYLPRKSREDVVWYYYTHKKTLNLKKQVRDSTSKRRTKKTRGGPGEITEDDKKNTNNNTNTETTIDPGSYWSFNNTERPTRATRSSVKEKQKTKEDVVTRRRTRVDDSGSEREEDSKPKSKSRRRRNEASYDSNDTTDSTFTPTPTRRSTRGGRRGSRPRVTSATAFGRSTKKPEDEVLPPAQPIKSKEVLKKLDTCANVSAHYWSVVERDLFKFAFLKFGRDFKSIANFVSTKNPYQCKIFYFANRNTLNLDEGMLQAQTRQALQKSSNPQKEIDSNFIERNVNRSQTSRKNPDGTTKRAVSYWTSEEKQLFMKYFRMYGRDWEAISEYITTKTQNQIKNFFQNYKVKLNLNSILEEKHANKGKRSTRAQTRQTVQKPNSSNSKNTKDVSTALPPAIPKTTTLMDSTAKVDSETERQMAMEMTNILSAMPFSNTQVDNSSKLVESSIVSQDQKSASELQAAQELAIIVQPTSASENDIKLTSDAVHMVQQIATATIKDESRKQQIINNEPSFAYANNEQNALFNALVTECNNDTGIALQVNTAQTQLEIRAQGGTCPEQLDVVTHSISTEVTKPNIPALTASPISEPNVLDKGASASTSPSSITSKTIIEAAQSISNASNIIENASSEIVSSDLVKTNFTSKDKKDAISVTTDITPAESQELNVLPTSTTANTSTKETVNAQDTTDVHKNNDCTMGDSKSDAQDGTSKPNTNTQVNASIAIQDIATNTAIGNEERNNDERCESKVENNASTESLAGETKPITSSNGNDGDNNNGDDDAAGADDDDNNDDNNDDDNDDDNNDDDDDDNDDDDNRDDDNDDANAANDNDADNDADVDDDDNDDADDDDDDVDDNDVDDDDADDNDDNDVDDNGDDGDDCNIDIMDEGDEPYVIEEFEDDDDIDAMCIDDTTTISMDENDDDIDGGGSNSGNADELYSLPI